MFHAHSLCSNLLEYLNNRYLCLTFTFRMLKQKITHTHYHNFPPHCKNAIQTNFYLHQLQCYIYSMKICLAIALYLRKYTSWFFLFSPYALSKLMLILLMLSDKTQVRRLVANNNMQLYTYIADYNWNYVKPKHIAC